MVTVEMGGGGEGAIFEIWRSAICLFLGFFSVFLEIVNSTVFWQWES